MSTVSVPDTRREIEAIALIGVGHGVSHFFHLMMPPLFPWLMAEFALSFTQAGALTALFFAVSGVGQFVAGFVVDRLGARRVLLAGIALLGASAVILALAPSYAVLLLAAAVAGLGNCVFHPADFTLLNRNISAPRLGHAFSVHGLAGNLGYAIAPVFMTSIALALDWRAAAFAAAAVALAALLPLWLRHAAITESPVQASATTTAPGAPTFAFLASGVVWLCFGFFLLLTVSAAGLQNFGPLVLQQLYGMSVAASASALTALLLGGAGGMVAGGFLVARFGSQERTIALVLSLAALVALAIASGRPPAWSVTALMAALGFCAGMSGPSRDMLVRRAATARFGSRAFGRVYGFVYSGLDLGFALSPVLLFGPLMDARLFATVLAAIAVSQALAVLAALSVGHGARTQRAA